MLYIAKNCAKDFFVPLTTFAPQYEGVLYKIILLDKKVVLIAKEMNNGELINNIFSHLLLLVFFWRSKGQVGMT